MNLTSEDKEKLSALLCRIVKQSEIIKAHDHVTKDNLLGTIDLIDHMCAILLCEDYGQAKKEANKKARL